MGKQVYLSDLEIKLLNGIMSSQDDEGMDEEESEALNNLVSKVFGWYQDTK